MSVNQALIDYAEYANVGADEWISMVEPQPHRGGEFGFAYARNTLNGENVARGVFRDSEGNVVLVDYETGWIEDDITVSARLKTRMLENLGEM